MPNTFSLFFQEITALGLPAYACILDELDKGILEIYAIKQEDNTYIYWHCLNTEKTREYPAYNIQNIIKLATIHVLPARYKNYELEPRDVLLAYLNKDYLINVEMNALTENIITGIAASISALKYNPDYTVHDGQEKKMNEINNTYDEAFNTIVINYPEQEVASFPLQESQAREYLTNNNADVKFLRTLYAGRVSRGYTETLEELCNKILTKASLFEPVSGYLSGIRQAMEKEIEEIVKLVENGTITHYQGYKQCMGVHVEYPILTEEMLSSIIT